jgi:glycosidase
MTVPGWVQDTIFYQIFPDRFANGDPTNDPPNVREWKALPTIKGFHGGDLKGIVDHMDYLVDLGINAIYLNPIFQAASTHRYDTYDYFKIDPKLGTLEDFHALIETAHANGIRVVIDGVFNHCGRGFFAFNDILENEKDSPYLNWFHVKTFPLKAYDTGDAVNYLGWWNFKSLPKFNTDEPAVRDYLLKVARYWIEQGADGWRLDVPNEIDDDTFWDEFRRVVKEANPDAYILGEIWDGNPRWVGEHHFDGLMHYPVRDAVFDVLRNEIDVATFADRVEELLTKYDRDNVYAMQVLLGSHDTKRIQVKFEYDQSRVKLASLFPFVYPGAPCIYYGDEIGMDGGKDPDCRRAFLWDQSEWNHDLRDWFKKLIQIRKERVSLRRGEYRHIVVNGEGYAFCRSEGKEHTFVVINFGEAETHLHLSCDLISIEEIHSFTDLLTGDMFEYKPEIAMTLPPLSAKILAVNGQ